MEMKIYCLQMRLHKEWDLTKKETILRGKDIDACNCSSAMCYDTDAEEVKEKVEILFDFWSKNSDYNVEKFIEGVGFLMQKKTETYATSYRLCEASVSL